MSQENDLFVNPDLTIPESELSWRFSTPGGPGGQHANRNRTRVELSWDVSESKSLSDSQRRLIVSKLGTPVIVVASESRSQWRNRRLARRRMIDQIQEALRRPPPRVPTKPTTSSRNKRIENKRHRSEVKRLRRRPDVE